MFYIGHSFGSSLGNVIATQYPQSCDAFVLTGYSAGLADNPLFTKPANKLYPRFAALSLGYQVSYNATNRQDVLYGPVGTFDPTMFSIDVATQDTITFGQYATIDIGFGTASNYTGPVRIISGGKDDVFCNNADCGFGTDSQLGPATKFFPAATNFLYYAVPDTGHDSNLQYTAREVFEDVHGWLGEHGF